MNWMTITWPMVAAACLTLGLIELGIGIAQRPRAPRLLFALSAFTVACVAALELALMQTDVLAEWWLVTRLLDTAVGIMIVSLTAFIWTYFGTGRKWLALAIPFIYVIGLSFDFFPGTPPGVGMTYQAFTGFRTVETFGGATFQVAEGVPNPWNVFPYLAVLAQIVFVADASLRLRRIGGGRRAVLVGGAIVLFFLGGGLQAALVDLDILKTPYMISWAYLAVLIAMSIELNADVLAGARLAGQLQERERHMDLASAAADLGMWTWDIDRDTIWATRRARELFGFSESEPINRARFIGCLHPEDREATDRALEHALATGGGYEVEYRVLLPEGKMRWMAARGQIERAGSGKPILLRGVVLDISARRGAELELQQLRNQLAHASRVSMMGQLASALAHELSQPLGAILRNTEAAELFLEHDPPDLDELRAILVDIRLDDQRAGGVIDRLRALLKRRSFVPRALSVSDELANVMSLARSDAATRKVALQIDVGSGLPRVMGDPVHLQQVLLNLILNAMDAVEDTPAARRKVTVRAQRHGQDEIEVAVEDSGPGIAPERLGRLFEPFFTTKANGMGIGLAISRTIIEAHGGRIWAENNAVEGATFRFTLPLAEAATPS
ncbi:MAG: multi-sensor signal transduction histidine kinase [Proteobacteria bacterium]|nr:multi-sensor signal transduction histidine kinase [Pseudomonadota bacterium]